MAIAASIGKTASNATATTTLAFAATAIGSGSDIVVAIAVADISITVTGIADTAGNAFSQRTAINGTGVRTMIWEAQDVIANAADIITITFSGATLASAAFETYTGTVAQTAVNDYAPHVMTDNVTPAPYVASALNAFSGRDPFKAFNGDYLGGEGAEALNNNQAMGTPYNSRSQAGTGPVAYPLGVLAGSLLVFAAGSEGVVDPLTVTDTLGTSYTKAVAYTANANHIAIYWGIAPSAGANTVTVTGLGTSFADVSVAEFVTSGTVTVDTTATAYGAASPVIGTIATTTATLIVAIQRSFHTNTFTANAPTVLLSQQNGGSDGQALAYQPISGAGTKTVSIAMTGSADNAPQTLAAFNNVTGPRLIDILPMAYLQIDLGTAYSPGSYAITVTNSAPYGSDRAPKTWELRGSNDNFTTYTMLNAQASQTAWAPGEKRTFTIASPGSFRYWRVHMTANNGDGSYTGILELNLFGSGLLLATPQVTDTSTDTGQNPNVFVGDIQERGNWIVGALGFVCNSGDTVAIMDGTLRQSVVPALASVGVALVDNAGISVKSTIPAEVRISASRNWAAAGVELRAGGSLILYDPVAVEISAVSDGTINYLNFVMPDFNSGGATGAGGGPSMHGWSY